MSAGRGLADHIAVVAARLFYTEGIHVVGVDRIAAEADITKRTLYRHFRSKDELIAAALRRAPRIRFPSEGPPAERVIGAFRALADLIGDDTFRGCPYINAAAELTDPRHPGRVVVDEFTTRRRNWFRDRAAELAVPAPDLLAEQLDVLFDGALANATKRNVDTPALAALAAAATLLQSAAPPRTSRTSRALPASAASSRKPARLPAHRAAR